MSHMSVYRVSQAAKVWCNWAGHARDGCTRSTACLMSMRYLSGQPQDKSSGTSSNGSASNSQPQQEHSHIQPEAQHQQHQSAVKLKPGLEPNHDYRAVNLETVSHHMAAALLSLKQRAVSLAQQVTARAVQKQDTATAPGQQGDGQSNHVASTEQQGTVLTRMQDRLATTATMLNELTGYSGVEQLKEAVRQAERHLLDAQTAATQQKKDYEASVARQLLMQKELQKLLERKSGWSDADVHRFAELCRDEARVGSGVEAARSASEAAVADVDEAQKAYMQAMRERYTEEQLWGDKIRRAATWYTWGLMGLQLVSFVAVLLVVEPRRVRLLQERVQEMLEEHEGSTAAQVQEQLQAQLAGIQHLLDTQRADVVMHALDGSMQTAAAAQAAGQGEQQAGPDLSKFLSAVVSFMDGVHAELLMQRQQLDRVTASVQLLQPSHLKHTDEVTDQAGIQTIAEVEEGTLRQGSPEQPLGPRQATQVEGTQHVKFWGRQLTVEQVIGIAAGVSAGVGAFLGVLLASYFTPTR